MIQGGNVKMRLWQRRETLSQSSDSVLYPRGCCCCLIAKSCLCHPMDCGPPGSSVLGFPGKNAGVGSHLLLWGSFPTQVLNPHLLHWQVDSLPLKSGMPGKLTEILDFLLGEILKEKRKRLQNSNYGQSVSVFNWERFRGPLLKVLADTIFSSDSVTD